jgi:hypothetical protein
MEGTPQKMWKKVEAKGGSASIPPLPPAFFEWN